MNTIVSRCIIAILLVALLVLFVRLLYIKRVLEDRTAFARGLLRDQKLSVRYIRFRQKQGNFVPFFHDHEYSSIAFYGLNGFGRAVLDDMQADGVRISYGLDEGYGEHFLEFDVFHPSCQIPQVDAVFLVTDNKRIREMVSESGLHCFVTLDEILRENEI